MDLIASGKKFGGLSDNVVRGVSRLHTLWRFAVTPRKSAINPRRSAVTPRRFATINYIFLPEFWCSTCVVSW